MTKHIYNWAENLLFYLQKGTATCFLLAVGSIHLWRSSIHCWRSLIQDPSILSLQYLILPLIWDPVLSFLARLHLTIVHNLSQKSKPMLIWYIGSKLGINIGMNTNIKYQTSLVWAKKSSTTIIPVPAGITISCYQTNTGPNLSPCPSSVTYVCLLLVQDFYSSDTFNHLALKRESQTVSITSRTVQHWLVYKVEFSILKKSFLSP